MEMNYTERRVLRAIENEFGNCSGFYPQHEMAEDLEVCKKTVSRAINSLKNKGMLTVTKIGRHNQYKLRYETKENQ